MAFSKNFLANKIFQDYPLTFQPAASSMIYGRPVMTGATTLENGDIQFRVFAANAKAVTLRVEARPMKEFPMAQFQPGIFEATYPFNETYTGPVNVDVLVDGEVLLDGSIPIHWTANRLRNCVEVPDEELDFSVIKAVPHGAVGREIFWSKVRDSWERYFIYTPPGYRKSTESYPVLYLQNGGGENETSWWGTGRAGYIMDNLIHEGKIKPFIIVMANATLRYKNATGDSIDEAYEKILIEDCIPHVEKTYRVKTGKWNRGIGGFSMGSYISCDIAFRHPDMFGSLGTFTASMTHEHFPTTYQRPYPDAMKDAAKFGHNFRVYFRSTTPSEDHFAYFEADDNLCARAGLDKLPGYHRIVYSPRTSKWNSWRMGLRDYAQLIFK